MINKYLSKYSIGPILAMLVFSILFVSRALPAQTTSAILAEFAAATDSETIPAGSFIIDMGVTPQTKSNGLKPYGMIYDLLKNYNVPVKWVINSSKSKDGTDFTYNGKAYRGGPFIIPEEFRTATVNSRISFWQGQGVQGITTTSPVSVPVFTTLFYAPSWTLNDEKQDIPEQTFTNASIPSTAYNDKPPSALGICDDVFVMPHDDPDWANHNNLLHWNRDFKGHIWYGCHAGGALENMYNPSNPSEQANFLCDKSGTATNAVNGFAQNTILWSKFHDDGVAPYNYDYPTHPVMQFMGDMDDVPNSGGAQQIYIPIGGAAKWRSTTFVGGWDPDNTETASNTDPLYHGGIMVFGRGFGDDNRGYVMMQGGHRINKEDGPDFIAAQRCFLNFSFLSMVDKAVPPSVEGITFGQTIAPGEPIALSFSVPAPNSASDFSAQWSSSCGGTFSPSSTAQNVNFTPPNTSSPTDCLITIEITDPCGRKTFDTQSVTIVCDIEVTTQLTQDCSGSGGAGAISMTITGGDAPFSYSWTRTEGGSGSGSGTLISGLSAGTYQVTVTAANGCTKSFTRTINQSPAINISVSTTPVACFGQTSGSISLTVSGGTPGFTYSWNDGSTSRNRSNLAAGTYQVTVTDSKGCTATASVVVPGPTSALNGSPTIGNVACFGESTGTISLSVSGGTPSYSYLWNDGLTTQNRTGLMASSYSVTITDANNCTQALSNLSVTQPASSLSLSSTQTNADCATADGSVTVTASGGVAPYTYDWSGTPAGDGTNMITGLSGGTYVVTVTDNNGCTAVLSALVMEASPLSLTVEPTNPECPPSSDPPLNSNGAIAITASGGTAPYSFAWTTTDGSGLNPSVEDQTGLTAGTYSVVVTDANGCSISTSVVLENNQEGPVTPLVINNN